eukprot:m.22839 g.22839  ORF g.22839 m.22839 type:complete len:230 (+) comp5485_c0_seq1:78-767(+)
MPARSTTTTATSATGSTFTSMKKKRSRETYGPRFYAALIGWTLFVAFSLASVIYAFSLPTWITGTEVIDATQPSNIRREVGLFVQCNYEAGQPDNCFKTGVSNNSTIWQVSSFFFAVATSGALLILLMVLSVLFNPTLKKSIIPWSKFIMSITSIVFIVAVTLFPLGFIYLDDDCASDNVGGCGLSCAVSGSQMEYFSLCSPYKVGSASFAMFAGVLAFFICSFCARCV